VYQPSLPETFPNLGEDLYAFSFFYDRMVMSSTTGTTETTAGTMAGTTAGTMAGKTGRMTAGTTGGTTASTASKVVDVVANVDFGLGLNPAIEEIGELAAKLCRPRHEYESVTQQDPYLCIDLTYVYTLLSYGYGIPEDHRIHVVKKIDEVEMGWCLGATLQMLDEFMREEGGEENLLSCAKKFDLEST